MRKLLCFAFVFLSAFAFGQTTAVVTGALVDQSETGTSSGISVDVTLVNTGSQRCFVNGVGTVATEKKNYTAAQILAGITLAKTANITCGASSGQTRWRFSFKNSALNTSRDCDLQISGATSLNTATCLQATTTPTTTVPTSSLYWLLDGSNSPTGNLVPAVNGTQSIGTSGSRWNMFANTMDVSGNVSVGGTLGVTGNVTEIAGQNQYKAFSINKQCWVDGIKYTSISSAYTDSANCNSVFVPTLGSACYTETLAANLVLNRSNVPITFEGCAVITQGAFQVTAPSGTNSISIVAPFVHSQTSAVNAGVVFSGYTGASAAWSIGDSSGFINNYYEHGISRNLNTGALANAQGLLLTNVVISSIEYPGFTFGGVSGQQGISTNSTGAFFTGLINISGLECNSSASATNNTCLFVGPITNSINLYGGHANMGGSVNGSACIDVNGAASSGVTSLGFDCDVAQTGVKVEATTNTAFWGFLRSDSGLTNIANFAASSQGNVIYTNANLPFTDNGTAFTNSVINPQRTNWRTDVWQMQQSASSMLFTNVGDAAHLIFGAGAGSQTRINGGTGAGQILFAFDNGTAGFQFCHGTASTASCTLWNPSTTAQRTLTSPDGNSSTAMPFNFTTTAATTDNVTVTGMTASGHCTLTPTNTAAAAGIASVFISAKAANQITVTHTATANWNFDGLCTSN